jgi:hypothetical protein
MKKLDIVIIAALLVVGALALVTRVGRGGGDGGAPRALIYVGGELYDTVYLADAPGQIKIQTADGYNILSVDADGVRMTEADCASQTCVHTAKRTFAGGVIACLPHRVLVRLAGDFGGGVDAVAG